MEELAELKSMTNIRKTEARGHSSPKKIQSALIGLLQRPKLAQPTTSHQLCLCFRLNLLSGGKDIDI